MTRFGAQCVSRVGAQSVRRAVPLRVGAQCMARSDSVRNLVLKYTSLSVFDKAGRVTWLLDFSGWIRYGGQAPNAPMA